MVISYHFKHLDVGRDGLLLEPGRNLVAVFAVRVVEVEDYLLVFVIAQLVFLSVLVFKLKVDGDIARQILVGGPDFEGDAFLLRLVETRRILHFFQKYQIHSVVAYWR